VSRKASFEVPRGSFRDVSGHGLGLHGDGEAGLESLDLARNTADNAPGRVTRLSSARSTAGWIARSHNFCGAQNFSTCRDCV